MTNNLAFLLGVAALILFIYGPLQWFMIDLLRHRLFELRDQTFDYAHEHSLFADKHYIELREFLNGSIRWAEQANGLAIPKALIAAAFFPRVMKSGEGRQAALEGESTPSAFRDAYRQAMKTISLVVLLRSPLLLVLLASIVLLLPLVTAFAFFIDAKVQPHAIRQAVERAIEADVAASEDLAQAA